MLKSVDKMFKEIGFIKIEETGEYVKYERVDDISPGTQVLLISRKRHFPSSVKTYYDNFLNGSTVISPVGLTYYETKLVLKKMKKIGWTY